MMTHPLIGSQNWIQVFNYGLRLTYIVVLAILLFKFKQFTDRVDKVHAVSLQIQGVHKRSYPVKVVPPCGRDLSPCWGFLKLENCQLAQAKDGPNSSLFILIVAEAFHHWWTLEDSVNYLTDRVSPVNFCKRKGAWFTSSNSGHPVSTTGSFLSSGSLFVFDS